MNLVRCIKVEDAGALDRFIARHKVKACHAEPERGQGAGENVFVVAMPEEEWRAFEAGLCDGVKYAKVYTLLHMNPGDTQPGEHKMEETVPAPTQSPARSSLPLWKCHKTVRAERIVGIGPQRVQSNEKEGGPKQNIAELFLADGSKRHIDDAWQAKHNPKIGDYFIQYDDGYTSVSPPAPFLAGYWLLAGSPIPDAWAGKPMEHAMLLLSNCAPDKSLPPEAAEQFADGVAAWLREYHEKWQNTEPRLAVMPAEASPRSHDRQAATVPATSPEALRNRYSYHAPKSGQQQRYEAIRAGCLNLALDIVAMTPGSPEQSLALNALDQVMFLANAAIARRE